jgi:hypothetical protein
MRRFEGYKMMIILSLSTLIILYLNMKVFHFLSNLEGLYVIEIDSVYKIFEKLYLFVAIFLPLLSAALLDWMLILAYKYEYLDLNKNYTYLMLIIPVLLYLLFLNNYSSVAMLLTGIIMINTVVVNSIMIIIMKRKNRA